MKKLYIFFVLLILLYPLRGFCQIPTFHFTDLAGDETAVANLDKDNILNAATNEGSGVPTSENPDRSTVKKKPVNTLTDFNNNTGIELKDKRAFNFTPLPTDYFRSNTVAPGDWNTAASWESSPDNITWSTATAPPNSAAQTITIRAGHTITVSSSINLDETVIDGILELQTSSVLNINDGAGLDINISGTGIINIKNSNANSYASIIGTTPATASINIATNGKITILGDGASVAGDMHLFASNTLTVWNDGSIFEWNCSVGTPTITGVTYFPNANATTVPIFRITSVSGIVTGTGATPFVLNGMLDLLISNVSFWGGGSKEFRDGISGTSSIITFNPIAAGTLSITSSTAKLSGTLTIVLNKTLNLDNGITIPLGANVLVNGSLAFGISKNGGNFLVNGTIDITDRTISNTSGNVTINGTLKTSKTNGFYNPGNIAFSVGGAIFINSGSTIEYNASVAQSITGTTTLGQSYYNITFSGSGAKTPISAINVNTLGTVKITGASVIVDAGTNNIGLTSANTTNFIMDNGLLILGTAETLPLMDGTYTLTGGTLRYTYSAAVEQKIRAKAYHNIEITGNNVKNSNGNIALNDNGTFVVKNSGVFTMRDNTITGPTGSQTVTVETSGTFKTENNEGFSGFSATFTNNSSLHQNIENIILQTNSTVNYSRDILFSVNGNQPITNTVSYQNLLISGTDTKTASSGTITVQGNLSKSGSSIFAHNNGTVVFNNSSTSQSFTNSSTTAFIFYNFTNSNTVALNIGSDKSVVNALSLSANSKLNLTAGNINLRSTSTNTAYISEVPANATITYGTGRFVVERYFPARRAWRLITAPVTVDATKTLFNSWQVGGNNTLTGSGTYISGPGENAAVNGLDVTPMHNYSLKTFNSLTSQFDGLGDTRSTLTGLISGTAGLADVPDNVGFFMFVRGDRTPANVNAFNPYGTVVETTLRDTGKILLQSYTFPCNTNASPNVFTLIGNPYASPVDFANLTKNGIANKFWAWDPKLNTVGGYVIVDLQGSGSITTVPIGGATTQTQIIQSKQAFLVETTNASSPNIVFNESAKSIINNLTLFRPVTKPNASLATNLYTVNADGTKNVADGVLAQFSKDYSDDLDHMDALKFGNVNETFSINSRNTLYMLQRRQPLNGNDTIFLSLKKSRQLNYRFNFIAGNLTANNLTAYLEDNFQKTSTPISMDGDTWFDFEVNGNAASAASDRFRMVFKKAAHYTNINAALINSDIAVEWSLINETDISNHEVERSADGIHFIKVGAVNSQGNGAASSIYNWLDVQPASGIYYYRIKSIGLYEAVAYSETVKVKMIKSAPGMYVFPNPVTDSKINLQLNKFVPGIYRVRVLNATGQELMKQNLSHLGGNATHTISPNQRLISGTYELEVMGPDKKKTMLKILVQ